LRRVSRRELFGSAGEGFLMAGSWLSHAALAQSRPCAGRASSLGPSKRPPTLALAAVGVRTISRTLPPPFLDASPLAGCLPQVTSESREIGAHEAVSAAASRSAQAWRDVRVNGVGRWGAVRTDGGVYAVAGSGA
jgi:hypothetical protein